MELHDLGKTTIILRLLRSYGRLKNDYHDLVSYGTGHSIREAYFSRPKEIVLGLQILQPIATGVFLN